MFVNFIEYINLFRYHLSKGIFIIKIFTTESRRDVINHVCTQSRDTINRYGKYERITCLYKELMTLSTMLSKLSLSSILIVPFVLQICVAVGLTGYFSFRNGQKAVNDNSWYWTRYY